MKQFENYLKTADMKQKMMIFLSFFIAVGFLLNQFVSPMLDSQTELQDNVDRLQLEISRNLSNKLKKQLSTKTKELLSAKEEFDLQKNDINFVMSNVYKIKYAFFNDIRWANTLDDMLRYSVQKNLKVSSLKSLNAIDDSKNIIKEKKSINITGVGRYANIVDFIQYIENFDTLLKFNKVDMKLVDDGVAFEFEISTYGVGL